MICYFVLRNLVKKFYYFEDGIEFIDFDEENENEMIVLFEEGGLEMS